jgi:hypothetical protein
VLPGRNGVSSGNTIRFRSRRERSGAPLTVQPGDTAEGHFLADGSPTETWLN